MASRSVNKVILLGHLGKDAETRYTTSGQAVSNFTLATNRRWKDQQTGEWKEETEWHNIVLWRAENVSSYLTKGKQVYVEGRLRTRSYEDKDGNKRYVTEVYADDVILLGGRGEGAPESAVYEASSSGTRPGPATARRSPTAAPEPDLGEAGITDDDVPF
jgi:single-strand DNA-binding protein